MLVKCLHCGLPETWMSSSVVVLTVGVGGAYGSNGGSALPHLVTTATVFEQKKGPFMEVTK